MADRKQSFIRSEGMLHGVTEYHLWMQNSSACAVKEPVCTNSTMRLGVVPYLNVQPLIWKLRQDDHLSRIVLQSGPPRQLAEELRTGKHDAAIVPVFEHIQQPGRYEIIP